MEEIISLYDELNRKGVLFYHWATEDQPAATIEYQGRYGVFMDFDLIRTSAEELVTVAHEGGHISTGATHKVDSPYDLVEKHEHKADKWAVQRVIPRDKLNRAIAEGYTELWQLSDYFGVTEDFMKKAVCWYTHGNLDTEYEF